MSIESIEDGACLQRDLVHIKQWFDLWQMDLNQSKCGLLSSTRNASPFHFPYQLSDVQVKTLEAQQDLGVLVTKHLNWNYQVLAACSKVNRMLILGDPGADSGDEGKSKRAEKCYFSSRHIFPPI